jgi:hypothetical protein
MPDATSEFGINSFEALPKLVAAEVTRLKLNKENMEPPDVGCYGFQTGSLSGTMQLKSEAALLVAATPSSPPPAVGQKIPPKILLAPPG